MHGYFLFILSFKWMKKFQAVMQHLKELNIKYKSYRIVWKKNSKSDCEQTSKEAAERLSSSDYKVWCMQTWIT